MVTFQWSLEKDKTIPDGTTIWKLKIKVCNDSTKKVKGKLVENPWKGASATDKILDTDKDKEGKPIPDSDKKKAIRAGKDMELNPGECKEVEFIYTQEPTMAYTDFYEYNPDGTLKPDWTWGTVHDFRPKKVGSIPNNHQKQYAFSFPIPYQMSISTIHHDKIDVTIEKIEGIPEQMELVSIVPGIGASYRLDFADRGSIGAIILRQKESFPDGHRSTITIYQRVMSPKELSNWPVRTVSFELANDDTAPEINITSSNINRESLDISAIITDDCSGISEISLDILYGEKWMSVTPQIIETKSDYSTGKNLVVVRFQVPLCEGYSNLLLRAIDNLGNSNTMNLLKLDNRKTKPNFEESKFTKKR